MDFKPKHGVATKLENEDKGLADTNQTKQLTAAVKSRSRSLAFYVDGRFLKCAAYLLGPPDPLINDLLSS